MVHYKGLMKEIIMSKTEMIRARIEPDLKKDVESIFSELGLTPTTAINIFYRQVKLLKGLPFNIRIPNMTTIQTVILSSGICIISARDSCKGK